MEQRVSTSEACCCVRLEIQFIVVLYFLHYLCKFLFLSLVRTIAVIFKLLALR